MNGTFCILGAIRDLFIRVLKLPLLALVCVFLLSPDLFPWEDCEEHPTASSHRVVHNIPQPNLIWLKHPLYLLNLPASVEWEVKERELREEHLHYKA